MTESDEKDRRLAEWESTCADMLFSGSLRAWRFFLLDEINNMLSEQLTNADEAKALRNRAESAYTARKQS